MRSRLASPTIRLKLKLDFVHSHFSITRWMSPIRALRNVCGRSSPRTSLGEAKHILVVRPDEIGDVVLTVPFLRELRRAAPRARIALIVKSACLELVEHSSYVDAVYALNFSTTGGRRHRLFLVLAAWRLRWNGLFGWSFDLVLLPRRGPDYYGSELVGYVLARSGALVVHREGRSSKSSSLSKDEPLAPIVYFNPVVEHEALHNLRFLRWCGAADANAAVLELAITESERRWAAEVLNVRCRYVALATGAGDAARTWPAERFLEIANWLRDSSGVTPILLGGLGDSQFDGTVSLIGRTTLRQAAAVIERCVLFVGNDSGLMHIAAAMGTPIVEISGFRVGGNPSHNNSPTRFSPIGVAHRVVQPPAGPDLMAIKDVTVDAVRLACSELLEFKTNHH